MKANYYDKFGEPIDDLLEWGRLFDDLQYKRIALTRLWHGARVSTVWLGIDHNFSNDDGPPLIFETMVFAGDYGDIDMDRYSTFADAVEGHEIMVRRWQRRPLSVWRNIIKTRLRSIRDRIQQHLTLGRKQSNG